MATERPRTGWPKNAGSKVAGSPALGDLDGDGKLEIVIGCDSGALNAWHSDGTSVTGWPQTAGSSLESAPALGDLDGDGELEVVIGSFDDKVYAWKCDATTDDKLPWAHLPTRPATHRAVHPAPGDHAVRLAEGYGIRRVRRPRAGGPGR